VAQRRRLALLALLGTAGDRGMSRDKLAGYLWPESDEADARHLLSDSVYVLRRALGEDGILAVGEFLRLNPELVWCDVLDFEAAIRREEAGEAVDLYAGPFLDGFYLGAAGELDQWVETERRRLADGYAKALESLAERAESASDYPVAVERWKQLAAHDAFNSRYMVRLMEALIAAGDPGNALQRAQEHEHLLREELGTEPAPEVLELAERLRREVVREGKSVLEAVPKSSGVEIAGLPAGWTIAAERLRARRRRVATATAAGVVVLALAVGAVLQYVRSQAEPVRLVVLPLANQGAADDEYYADGITDEIRNRLGAASALDVIARLSSLRYKDTEKTIEEIGDELDVEYIVGGTLRRVQREGGESPVRVTAELIRVSDRVRIWNGSYNASGLAIFDVQIGIAERVAEELEVNLLGAEREALRTRPTDNLQAYEDYLRGLYQWNKRNLDGWEAAIDHFQQSIEKDPSYASAHAMLSLTHSLLGYYSVTPPAASRSWALEAAERAVALDNSLAEAHASLAYVEMSFEWDWAAADRASQEGLRLNPESTMALYSRATFLSWVGRHEEAVAVTKRAIELDPVAPHVSTWLGIYYFMARRYDEAIGHLNKVVALEPDYRDAHIWLCYSYAKKGMHEEAARESERVTGYRQSWWPEAWILAVAGQSAQARNLINQIPAEESETPVSSYFLAPILGELGEKDRAFAALERAYRGRTPMMAVLKVDPRIDSLRDDPRFEDLLRRMDFP
jgi:DNA-binding SARP family transcriptional activator/TolB-like protein